MRYIVLFLLIIIRTVLTRSPLDLLSSSVQAIQQISHNTPQKQEENNKEINNKIPLAFILLSPKFWKETSNRREDMDYSESSYHPYMLIPAELSTRSRTHPLKFIAALPVNTDPLLTKGELSEVVYYSSIDLRKLNTTSDNNIGENNNNNEEDEYDYVSELYEDIDITTTIPIINTPSTTSSTTTTSTTTSTTTTTTTTIIDDDRKKRSWSNKEQQPKAVISDNIVNHDRDIKWMDNAGENLAYIIVATCCTLSILTLGIVLLIMRIRTVINNRNNINQNPSNLSDISSSIFNDDDDNDRQLPEKLLNLLNTRSQEVSTHKLGSWFNGRPTSTLSMKHSTSITFPAPIKRFPLDEQIQQNNEQYLNEDEIIVSNNTTNNIITYNNNNNRNIISCEENSESSNGDDDFIQEEIISPVINYDDHFNEEIRQVEEDSNSSNNDTISESGSRHDTFIFWSTNTDRLV